MKHAGSLILILGNIFCMGLSAQVQWASTVLGFSSQTGTTCFAAIQALGKPNVSPKGGDLPTAWKPSGLSGSEFIQVGFAKPMKIRQVIIAESWQSTAITKVELLGAGGTTHVIYKGKAKVLPGGYRLFHVAIPLTTFEVQAVKITLDLLKNGKFAAIDAIGISDSETPYEVKPNLATDVKFAGEKENLGEPLNSTYDEFLPVIAPDGKTLYFSREGDPSNFGGQDAWSSALGADGKWGKAVNMGPVLNNKNHNFICAVSPDGNQLLLGGNYSTGSSKAVSISRKGSDGTFLLPEEVPIPGFYNKNRFNEFFLSHSGLILMMTVERDDSYGEKDIYVSFLQENGTWSEPKNVQGVVNTAADESGPFLAADEKTLYFSSNGHLGYGSNDIFMTRRLDDSWTHWSEPLNLGPVINTPNWDGYYSLAASGDYGYLSSQQASIGGMDIFRVKLPKAIQPDPVTLVSGTVYDQKTQKPVGANIHYVLLEDGKEAGEAISDPSDGSYKISLPFGKKYAFSASAPGFIAVNENLDLTQLKEYTEVKRDLYLVPMEVGQTVRLNNIFFETAKYDLLPESYLELDKLVRVLNENPAMEIEIEGHTDDVGPDAANLVLSKNRARSVLDYLTAKGITGSRLKSAGFGETKPVAENKTEDGRAVNRRVQFTIRKK